MASETVSSKCATNEDQADCIECVVDSLNRDRMTKSWSPDGKIIASEKCYCSDKRTHAESPHLEKRRLFKTYSSYEFKNLKKNQSRSHWSLVDGGDSWNGDKNEDGGVKKGELTNFQRCLKLLGLNLSNDRLNSDYSRHKLPDTKTVKPKIVTRLKETSVSLENIHDAILRDFEKNHPFDPQNRSFLSKAVYERWYFNKLQEQRKQQKEKELKNELLRMEFERMRCEQKLKAEKSYKEWIQKKKSDNAFSKPKSESNEKGKRNADRKFLPKSPEKEYMKWKKTKNDEYLKRKKEWKEHKQHEIEDKERRKVDAEKAYRAWQNKASEELKKQFEEKQKQIKQKREEETRKKAEKEREAVSTFDAWKKNKSQKLKQVQEQQKFESRLKKEARNQRLTERLYEAEQAFYEWLNSVDKRMNSGK